MNKRKKKCLNRNINRLSNRLFDAGLPLYAVTEITHAICDQIREHEEENKCTK